MLEKTQRSGAKKAPDLIFTCSRCSTVSESVIFCCAKCKSTLFKVARSPNGTPLLYDDEAQLDPYRQKKNDPDIGTQFNNFGSEESQTSTVGGPNTRDPVSEYNSNPDGRPLPTGGSVGGSLGELPSSHYTEQVADGSPTLEPTHQKDVNPFNFMRSLKQMKQEDPYDLVRRRRFR